MRKKWMGILLSACVALGSFMADGAVALAYDHGDAGEYCDEALMEYFSNLIKKCETISQMYEDEIIGVILEDGSRVNCSEKTKYWISQATAEAYWTASDYYMWNENSNGKVDVWDSQGYLGDADTNDIRNWNDDGMLTSIKRSEMLDVINHMEAVIKPIWDVIHPASKGSESRKSAAEKAAEKAERLKAEEERKALEEASRGSVRLEKEAAENGFANGAQMQDAKAKGKSADEYYNNAVVDTPGIENPVPVAQGGKLVVDGKTTNMTATIEKVSSIYVDSIRAARQGTLLNVVKVNYPAAEAVITFYMPGVQTGDVIMAA